MECHALGYADDLCGLLADTSQLPRFKTLLGVYERGSGAENDWAEKTVGLRVGNQRGLTYMPEWDGPTEQKLFGEAAVIRYLGVFLGAPEVVAREWTRRVTAKVRARSTQWAVRGGARTLYGRNIVVRNSVMAVAWYLVSNQCPPGLDDMLAAWEKATWQFVESPAGTVIGTTESVPTSHVATRALLVQDYPEGGARCLDVEAFARALYMRHPRRLLDPVEQSWKGMAMHFINSRYGALRQGLRLLVSACDFLALLEDGPLVPDFWQTALVAWGMYPAPIPFDPEGPTPGDEAERRQRAHSEQEANVGLTTVLTRGLRRPALPQSGWTLMRVMMEPLAYNQHISGVWGARVLETAGTADVLRRTHAAGTATIVRVSSVRRRQAADVLHRYVTVARAGFTHVMHLLVLDRECKCIRLRRYGELRCRGQQMCMTAARYRQLVDGMPAEWHEVLATATASLRECLARGETCTLLDLAHMYPLPRGAWVRLPDGLVARVGDDQTVGGQRWHVSPAGRLETCAQPADQSLLAVPRLQQEEAHVWRSVWCAHSQQDEEQEARRVARQGRGRAVHELVFGGLVAQGPLVTETDGPVLGDTDAGRWAIAYGATDRVRTATPLVGTDTSHLYAMQLSRSHVIPRTMDGSTSNTSTTWVDALDHPTERTSGNVSSYKAWVVWGGGGLPLIVTQNQVC